MGTTIFTVTIVDHGDDDCEPWVSSFSDRDKANAFISEAKARLKRFGADDHTTVSLDHGDLDDDEYLEWIDERYDLDRVDPYYNSVEPENAERDTAIHSAKNGEEINNMDMTIRDMTPQERLYTYAQSQQIRAQTGSIGHLRGYFDKSGKDFGHIWEPHSTDLITDDFRTEFDQVVNALRSDERYGTLLKSPGSMTRYSFAHPDSVFDKRGNTFGVRADTKKYTYLLRLTPDRGEYNVYCYCYRADWLAQHMARAQRGIRFITPDYNEKFRIPDGDEIRVTAPDGESHDYECRYIDDYHFELDGACHNLYHIAEFAERMERNGNTIIPLRSSLPEYCHSVLPTSGELILISRGTEGYMPANEKADGETGRDAADRLNQRAGITKAQEEAMLAGSMFGWAVPAADPKNYDDHGLPRHSSHKHNDMTR